MRKGSVWDLRGKTSLEVKACVWEAILAVNKTGKKARLCTAEGYVTLSSGCGLRMEGRKVVIRLGLGSTTVTIPEDSLDQYVQVKFAPFV